MRIYRRKNDGRWCTAVELPRGPDGKRRKKYLLGRTKSEVSEKAAKYRIGGQVACADAGAVTIARYFDQWLESMNGRIAETTHENYEQVVRSHVTPHIGAIRLADLKPSHVAWLYDHHAKNGVSGAVSRKAANILSKALNDAVRRQMIVANPSDPIEKPKPKRREMRFLNREEFQRFIAAARGHRLESLFVVAAMTGMRMGELLRLRWDDIDFDAGEVFVQRAAKFIKGKAIIADVKTAKSRRRIVLPAPALSSLVEHRKCMLAEGNIDRAVFCGRRGAILQKSNLRERFFKPVRDAAGVPPIRFHDLRHTAASLLLSEGVPVSIVSQMLGHSNPHVTLTVYTHFMPSDLGVAAAAMARIAAC